MKADFTALQAEIEALAGQATVTEGLEASAVVLIEGFATAVTSAVEAALTADNSADNGSITAAKEAIAVVRGQFVASAAKLSAAIVAGQPTS